MKTVAEFARENNVTPQTIYRKINKAINQGSNDGVTFKEDNITYITEKGEELLYSFLGLKWASNPAVQSKTSSKTIENEEIIFLREQLKNSQEQVLKLQEVLDKEREHSRTMADKLATITEHQQKLLENQQTLLRMEQFKQVKNREITKLISEKSNKKGWQFWK